MSPVGGVAAVGQQVRFGITIENDGGLLIPAISLRDTYDPWCLTARRAEFPPDAGGGGLGFLQWNDLGSLAPGESMSLWVEFIAAHACDETINQARAEGRGASDEGEATVRILEYSARIVGRVCHDQNNDGLCRADEPGVQQTTVELQRLASTAQGDVWTYTTNISGWYSFNMLGSGDYLLRLWPLDGWTPTTPTEHEVTLSSDWETVVRNFGLWWGDALPPEEWPPGMQTTVCSAVADAEISAWDPGANRGGEVHMSVRQPGVISSLVRFDLAECPLPEGAELVRARLKLYSTMRSNETNRLYVVGYPLLQPWDEGQVTWLQRAVADGAPVLWEEVGATGATDHGDRAGWGSIGDLGPVELTVTTAVQQWLADPASNHGLLLRGEGSENRKVSYAFLTKEYPPLDPRPRLELDYVVTSE